MNGKFSKFNTFNSRTASLTNETVFRFQKKRKKTRNVPSPYFDRFSIRKYRMKKREPYHFENFFVFVKKALIVPFSIILQKNHCFVVNQLTPSAIKTKEENENCKFIDLDFPEKRKTVKNSKNNNLV